MSKSKFKWLSWCRQRAVTLSAEIPASCRQDHVKIGWSDISGLECYIKLDKGRAALVHRRQQRQVDIPDHKLDRATKFLCHSSNDTNVDTGYELFKKYASDEEWSAFREWRQAEGTMAGRSRKSHWNAWMRQMQRNEFLSELEDNYLFYEEYEIPFPTTNIALKICHRKVKCYVDASKVLTMDKLGTAVGRVAVNEAMQLTRLKICGMSKRDVEVYTH